MRREIAIRRALRVADRVREAGGLIPTPRATHEFFEVKKIWLFGSTAKGSESPNDIDLLYEGNYCGARYTSIEGKQLHKFFLGMGVKVPVDSEYAALKIIAKGCGMVRLHDAKIDGEIAYPRIQLYPINELAA